MSALMRPVKAGFNAPSDVPLSVTTPVALPCQLPSASANECLPMQLLPREFVTSTRGVTAKESKMYLKLAAVAVMSMLLSTAAFAQTQTASDKGQWQASKLIHMNVYNDQNEKIGDIKELMLDKNGKVNTVAIGVGGFLGMGERDVAVKFDQLKWSNEPPKSTSSGAGTTTGSAQSQANRDRNYPDHAVLAATKDQLKAMPQFDYNK